MEVHADIIFLGGGEAQKKHTVEKVPPPTGNFFLNFAI